MDKEAVGMEREAVERAVREVGGIVHRDGNIFFTDYQQMQAAMALAQQPAAQAAGLTECLNAHMSRFGPEPAGISAQRESDFVAGWNAAIARAAPSGEPVAYVECRECGRCGHTGINDAHSQDECCSNCDWTGPAPKEDVCPGCAQTGTMRAACPKCGSVYRLLCETTVGAATQPSAQQAEQPAEEALGPFNTADEAIAALRAEEARGVDDHALASRWNRIANSDDQRAAFMAEVRALLAAPAADKEAKDAE